MIRYNSAFPPVCRSMTALRVGAQQRACAVRFATRLLLLVSLLIPAVSHAQIPRDHLTAQLDPRERVVTGMAGGCDITLTVADSNIAAKISSLVQSNYTICLTNGTYNFVADSATKDAVVISNVENFTIRGEGYYTRLAFDDNVKRAFVLRDSIRNVEISHFRMGRATEPVPGEVVEGIASEPNDTLDIIGVLFTGLDIYNVSHGIIIGGHAARYPNFFYDDVLVANNSIHNVVGFAADRGYGISIAYATNVRVVSNEFRNVGRHSVYVGAASPQTLIAYNNVVNHGYSQGNARAAAIAIARSPDITVLGNRFVNSQTHALSAEPDNDYSRATTNIQLIGNQFIGTHTDRADIWIHRNGTTQHHVVLWANEADSLLCEINLVEEDCDPAVVELEPPNWSGTQSIRPARRTLEDNRLYVMRNNVLHTVDASWGTHPNSWSSVSSSPTNWSTFKGMTVMNDRIYVMKTTILWEVDPNTWQEQSDCPPGGPPIGCTDWSGFTAMAAYAGHNRVFLVDAPDIYKIDPVTWTHTSSSTIDWSGTTRMAEGMSKTWTRGGLLFLEKGGAAYKVNPYNLYADLIENFPWPPHN